jgi:nuclear transport factor 2 (NTF2) superfamily protein
MVMTPAMNIWGTFFMSCKWRDDYHPYMMTQCVIHTCACTHTILTQRQTQKAGWNKTEAMAVSLSLTNLSHWLSRGISSFNNRERKRQRYQKGKKNIHKYTVSYQFASFIKQRLR